MEQKYIICAFAIAVVAFLMGKHCQCNPTVMGGEIRQIEKLGGPVNCPEDDVPPDNRYTCAQQASWGKCNEPWMAGKCNHSCRRCPYVGAFY
jgi:hypothetical protein